MSLEEARMGRTAEEDERREPARLLNERELRELEETWREPPPLLSWFTNTDHKTIGKRYIVTALAFFLLGGIEAALMRLQLMKPENNLLGPDLYNQVFTMHGSTMMFLFAVPVMEGIGLYLVPLMVGTRNVSFPRMNAFGYYMFLAGGLMLYGGFFFNTGPDAGWFAYVPLSGPEFSPGKRVDIWAQMISFTEIAALVGAVEIATTVFKQRAPGMSLNRIPLYVWALVVTSFMVLFAMPAVMLASSMLATDRMTHVSTHFFNPAEGGDAILWQHLFWFFGHPEVYIIFIPATGFVSAIIATFARRPVFGYTAMVLSLISVGFIGFGLWVHHMFATPLPQLGQSFFTGASMMIAIPNGIQIFCWIATLWGGKLNMKTPLYFVLGFIAIFVLGGLSGIVLASVPLDTQVHDTYFVVAHFHYVLIGGAVFPLFGALHYWMPKWTGRMMGEGLGKLTFWLLFAGFNLTFFPMHQLGLAGMPRRVYTYLPGMGWENMNLTATVGAGVMALGVMAFAVNFFWSRAAGRVAGENPWGADSLEWGTSSPPPPYNFAHIPVVQGRSALWERTEDAPVVVGLDTKKRTVLATTIVDAAPSMRHELPGPSIWPFVLALAVSSFWVGIVYTPYAIYFGTALTALAFFGWFWSDPKYGGQKAKRKQRPGEWRPAEDPDTLPAEARG
ncbi:MAG TPA: cytochrome c oxidase subunit I [Pyrinomonadaceae bacterium]|nr:cytochrome c oxidase subunit I [Pyrinomonadaceae bacterium]